MTEALGVRDFGPYQVEDLIGRGGMGVVYRATDRALERPVALKLLDPELARDPDFRRRFVSESKLAASLDHPHVIPIHQAGEHDGVLFIAMRYVVGTDLRGQLAAHGRMAPERATRILGQVAAALDAAHERGLVHRDVKPANVLLARDDHAYLTDFGLCTRSGGDDPDAGRLLGTLDFLAPEQVRGETTSPATDVYALGCTAFNLLTGRVPYPVDTHESKLWAHLSEPPPSARVLVPGLPDALDEAIARAMSKDPHERFATAGGFASAARAALAPARERAAPPVRRAPASSLGRSRSRPDRAARAPARPARAKPTPTRAASAVAGALVEPFNLAIVIGLLAAGLALDRLALLAPLALALYAGATALSLRERRRQRPGVDRRARGRPGS